MGSMYRVWRTFVNEAENMSLSKYEQKSCSNFFFIIIIILVHRQVMHIAT